MSELVIWDGEIVELGDVQVIDFEFLRASHASAYDVDDLRRIRATVAEFEGTDEYLAELDEWITEAMKEEA